MRARRRPKSMMSRLVASLAALAVAAGVAAGVAACAHGRAGGHRLGRRQRVGGSGRRPADGRPGRQSRGEGVRRPRPPGVRVGQQALRSRRQRGRRRPRAAPAPGHDTEKADRTRRQARAPRRRRAPRPGRRTAAGSPSWSAPRPPTARSPAARSGWRDRTGRTLIRCCRRWPASPGRRTADELAATSGLGGKLFAVRPGKPTYPMLEVPGQFDGAPAWSPNGREVAVATVDLTAAKRFASSVIDLFVPSEGIVVNGLASSRTDALIVDGWWAERRRAAGLVRPARLGRRCGRRRAAARLLPARRRADRDAAEHPGLPLVRGAGRRPA